MGPGEGRRRGEATTLPSAEEEPGSINQATGRHTMSFTLVHRCVEGGRAATTSPLIDRFACVRCRCPKAKRRLTTTNLPPPFLSLSSDSIDPAHRLPPLTKLKHGVAGASLVVASDPQVRTSERWPTDAPPYRFTFPQPNQPDAPGPGNIPLDPEHRQPRPAWHHGTHPHPLPTPMAHACLTRPNPRHNRHDATQGLRAPPPPEVAGRAFLRAAGRRARGPAQGRHGLCHQGAQRSVGPHTRTRVGEGEWMPSAGLLCALPTDTQPRLHHHHTQGGLPRA